jgi:antitoxin SocA-like protein
VAPADRLDSPLARAMLYVVRELGQVSVVKLEKILYLADLEYFHKTGDRFTGAKWVRHRLGPMAKGVVPATDRMRGHELEVTEEPAGEHTAHVYRPGPSPRFEPSLSLPVRATLDPLIAMLKPASAMDAAELSYRTTPMLRQLMIEHEAGRELWNSPLVFDRSRRGIAQVAVRRPRASAEERADFKHQELERVRDLQAAAIGRSEGA